MNKPSSFSVACVVLIIGALSPRSEMAQTPSPSVSAGFGVDTTIADVGSVFSLVRAYLAKPDSSARSRGLWSTASEFDRTRGDVTAWQVNQGFPATVVGIIPAVPGDSVYLVRILYARADSVGTVSPLALQRLYAIREVGAPFRFRLSGSFPHLRRAWEQRSKGRLTFWYVPGQRPNPGRVDAAVRFVDSVSKLFSVPVPRHLDVIVGQSMDDVWRAIGLDFFPEASGPGQRSGGLSMGYIILSGNPAIGEAYFHELVHAVLGPSLPAGTRLLSEGVATWLGGSRGRTPRELYRVLRSYQHSDSTLTFSGLIKNDFRDPDDDRSANLLYGSGGLIADSIYRKGGIAALRNVYQVKGDPDSVIRAISTALGFSPTDIVSLDKWWRTETERAARGI